MMGSGFVRKLNCSFLAGRSCDRFER